MQKAKFLRYPERHLPKASAVVPSGAVVLGGLVEVRSWNAILTLTRFAMAVRRTSGMRSTTISTVVYR